MNMIKTPTDPAYWTPETIADQTTEFLKMLQQLIKANKDNMSKMYHYGLTVTRNPTEQSETEFLTKVVKMLTYKCFRDAEISEWALEAYSRDKKINDHIHIYLKTDQYLSIKDLKRNLPKNRIDVQRLTGINIPKTRNYIKKDILHEQTIQYYENLGIKPHYNVA